MFQLLIGTDSRPFMSFHEEDQLVFPFSELLGNLPYKAGRNVPANSKEDIRMERRYSVRLNKGEAGDRCNEDNTERLQLCLQEYAQRIMNCSLPWMAAANANNRRLCDTTEDLRVYGRILARVASPSSQLRDILRETPCQINCRTVEYTARRISLQWNATSDSQYQYSLAMPQTSTVEESEVVTYDMNNFIADVGGLLGLLLGVSIMDLAALVEGVAERIKRWKKKP